MKYKGYKLDGKLRDICKSFVLFGLEARFPSFPKKTGKGGLNRLTAEQHEVAAKLKEVFMVTHKDNLYTEKGVIYYEAPVPVYED